MVNKFTKFISEAQADDSIWDLFLIFRLIFFSYQKNRTSGRLQDSGHSPFTFEIIPKSLKVVVGDEKSN
jgi:hypothetical protein